MTTSPQHENRLEAGDALGPGEAPARRAARETAVRIVEYAPFPHVLAARAPRIGFTRDLSPVGLCLGTEEPEPVGTLLRVNVRALDGSSRASVARVVWCRKAADSRAWLGLDLLSESARASVPGAP